MDDWNGYDGPDGVEELKGIRSKIDARNWRSSLKRAYNGMWKKMDWKEYTDQLDTRGKSKVFMVSVALLLVVTCS